MNTKLKNAREKQGLTQIEVAKKIQVSTISYQRYETEKRVPNVNIAKMIAKVLNCKVEDLF